MDPNLNDTYEKLASGALDAPDEDQLRALLYRCFEEGAHESVERRLGALRVAGHLMPRDRMRVVDPLLRDADPRVRHYAFNLAVAARADGIEALRTAIEGPDTELAVEALGLLVTQLDRPSSLHARQWLKHADPRIRAGAAMLLGNVSGPAMAVHLGRLAQSDPHPGVRLVAAEAVARCTGEAPKLAARDFWVAGATPLELPDAPAPTAPVATPPMPNRKLPPRSSGNLSTLYPDDFEPPEPEVPRDLVPSAGDAPEQVRDAAPTDWRKPIPLPGGMPTEAAAILKLFGRVSAPDRVHVLTAWINLPEPARRAALAAWSPGGDPAIGRGAALVVGATDSKTHASMLRHMLQDPDAGVRAAAAEAVGATGTLSAIPWFNPTLTDPDPDVRIAAVRGLAALLLRQDRPAMLRERLAPHVDDADPRVREAVADAVRQAST